MLPPISMTVTAMVNHIPFFAGCALRPSAIWSCTLG